MMYRRIVQTLTLVKNDSSPFVTVENSFFHQFHKTVMIAKRRHPWALASDPKTCVMLVRRLTVFEADKHPSSTRKLGFVSFLCQSRFSRFWDVRCRVHWPRLCLTYICVDIWQVAISSLFECWNDEIKLIWFEWSFLAFIWYSTVTFAWNNTPPCCSYSLMDWSLGSTYKPCIGQIIAMITNRVFTLQHPSQVVAPVLDTVWW